nr:phage virion morphogenesis protein [uncultured Rhodopila sp.]
MAGQMKVEFKGDSIAAGFRALQKLGHEPAGMLRAIGAALVETTHQRFERGRDPQGQPWKPWSRGYAAITKSNSILRGRGGAGGLMQSVTFAVDGRGVRVGSNKIYAGVHQFGATIVPVKAKALFFFVGGAGGRVFPVHAKKVTIPARPYLGFGPADRAAVHEIVLAELRQALAARRG